MDRSDGLHDLHDLVGVLTVEADGPSVDAGEALEQRGLAFHTGKAAAGPRLPSPRTADPCGDYGDRVALDREPANIVGVLCDGDADAGYPLVCRPATGRRGA